MAESFELRDYGERKVSAQLHPIRPSTQSHCQRPADIPQRDIDNFRSAFHYEIGQQIGKGAFGTVYRGTYVHNVSTWYRDGKYECVPGQSFAVKYINIVRKPHWGHDWYDEAVAMIELDHRNLVSLITVVTMSGKRLYIFMEYCDKGSMEDLFARFDRSRLRRQQISEYQAQQWCAQILLGLQFIHRNNYAHLDIHTGNILFKTDHENRNEIVAKISDFGIAKPFTADRLHEDLKGTSVVFTQLLFMNRRTKFRSDQSRTDANNMVKMLARRQYNTVDTCLTNSWLTERIEPEHDSGCIIL